MRKLATLVMLIALVSGCADDNGGGTTTPAPGETTTTLADEPGNGGSADHTIVITGTSFGTIGPVTAGQTVEVRNDSNLPHTWTSADGEWDSGSLSADATFSHTFDTPGSYDFFCSIHPSMTGTVTVEG